MLLPVMHFPYSSNIIIKHCTKFGTMCASSATDQYLNTCATCFCIKKKKRKRERLFSCRRVRTERARIVLCWHIVCIFPNCAVRGNNLFSSKEGNLHKSPTVKIIMPATCIIQEVSATTLREEINMCERERNRG